MKTRRSVFWRDLRVTFLWVGWITMPIITFLLGLNLAHSRMRCPEPRAPHGETRSMVG